MATEPSVCVRLAGLMPRVAPGVSLATGAIVGLVAAPETPETPETPEASAAAASSSRVSRLPAHAHIQVIVGLDDAEAAAAPGLAPPRY